MPTPAPAVPAAPTPPDQPVHTLPAAEVAGHLGVDPATGLSAVEAAERATRFGPNELREAETRSRWRLLADQFRSPLILVLIAAAAVAAAVGDLKDPIVIGVVLLLNAGLGFVQEHRAEQSMDALKQMLRLRVAVRRDGAVREVDSTELVPGDVVLLDAGDRVPADGRLLVAVGTAVDESSLTGESTPVETTVDALADPDLPLADRSNCLYMHTTVTRGRAEMVVTRTGMATEIGGIAAMLQAAPAESTPLQRQLGVLGARLGVIAGVAVALVFVVAMARGDTVGDALLDAVALAVAAIPEGLPAVVTLTLAVGTHRMARRNAIVKRLASVETLGSTTVICSDKTGTLTLNQMTATEVHAGAARYVVDGSGYELDGEIRPEGAGDPDALRAVLVTVAGCNDASVDGAAVVGDPTEGALVVLAAKGGVGAADAGERVAEVPFDSATKLMATFHRRPDGTVGCHVKGAADVVVPRCDTTAGTSGAAPLDPEAKAETDALVLAMSRGGLRVLAAASRVLDADEASRLEEGSVEPADLVRELHLEGLVGIVDPPRAEAADAIALCRRAGIAVKMITGDHAATASAIAARLGIEGEVVTGADLQRMSDDELAQRIEGIGVCARVAPEHKVRVVHALRANGHIVAMTGDGVNDAAALKVADIGVAMGQTGTEVTKEAADMVLADDDFATIVRAVEGGRTVYANILTFVRFQLSTNIGAIITILGARLIGLPAPFTPIQVLWVNLIMDGPPAMALGVDPPNRRTMQQPPRDARAAMLTVERVARLAFFGATMAVGTLAMLEHGRSSLPGDAGAELGTTLAFTTFVLFQFFNTLNARSEHVSALGRHSLANGKLWGALGVVLVLQVLAVQLAPLQAVFDTATLSWSDWLLCAAVASTVLWVEEIRKLVVRTVARWRGQRPAVA